ncbi:MAG: AMP-binding protein [Chlamydiales bacterium]|jgi:long-chain-fatty-acid--[acyl-carrier-protein] ligase|nr:AMP-binding protein [Chlamydiales bacterium]
MEQSRLTTWVLNGFCWMIRKLLSLRYRIKICGWEHIKSHSFKKPGGILFLPNHPAEIDPVIVESLLWPLFRPRALVVEHFYYLKGFLWLMKLVKAIPLPSMDAMASKWRGKKVDQCMQEIVKGLKEKNHFMIYPSGRLKISGFEIIGGASFVHRLLQFCPDLNIVLVRTTGLWGSQFSRAITGTSPNFGQVLRRCAKLLCKSGFFFMPKRNVKVEFSLPPLDFPWDSTRVDFNKYLEEWYNRYPEAGAEPLTLISYSPWKKKIPKLAQQQTPIELISNQIVTSGVQKAIFAHLHKITGCPEEKITREMNLSRDLGLDSLDIAGLCVFLEEQYAVIGVNPEKLQVVEDLLQSASASKKEKNKSNILPPLPTAWMEKKKRPRIEIPAGETMGQVLLRSLDRMSSSIACADHIAGVISYSSFKCSTLALSSYFRSLPGEYIGVLLPSSVAAYLVISAIWLSNKIPVMLNWTMGTRSLDHAVDLIRLPFVVTSHRFLDRLNEVDFGKLEENSMLFLEDIKQEMGIVTKLKAALGCVLPSEFLIRYFGLDRIKKDQNAVILFTSGTEAFPKAVGLSHENLLTNQRDCVALNIIEYGACLYAVLPPFHSMGFSLTGMMPILAGVKTCYAPDPTDNYGMAQDIAYWKPTLFCCSPSFIQGLFRVAKPKELGSLRLILSGAEKAPDELFIYVKRFLPEAQLIEGYGTTECSPLVTTNLRGIARNGVGFPLKHTEICILDVITKKPKPLGQEGEIYISGLNVFKGYLDSDSHPFIVFQEKKWYASGDLGYITPEGALILSGRLKRMIKIGGEMIGLGGIEDKLIEVARHKQWLTSEKEDVGLAISMREIEAEKPQLILFTTFSVSKEEINTVLKEEGFGKIVKVSEVRMISQIPLTGTGKKNYRLLDELSKTDNDAFKDL